MLNALPIHIIRLVTAIHKNKCWVAPAFVLKVLNLLPCVDVSPFEEATGTVNGPRTDETVETLALNVHSHDTDTSVRRDGGTILVLGELPPVADPPVVINALIIPIVGHLVASRLEFYVEIVWFIRPREG
jgi:hypothetical protein